MRLYRLTFIGFNALVTTPQLQAYYDGLISIFGMNPVGAPLVRDGVNGKLATCLFNDGVFTLVTWKGRFMINCLLLRDDIDKTQLESFTKTAFALTSFRALLDDMGNYD